MTTRHQVETMSLVTLAAFLGVSFAVFNNHNRQQPQMLSQIPVMQVAQVPVVTPVSPLPRTDITSQISIDGTKKVILKTTYNNDNTQTYAFSTADSSGANEQAIFSRTLDNSKIMTIPFNTLSPDSKYFFIQEQTKDGIVTDVLVFKTSGETFPDGETYFDVTNIFAARNTGNTFHEATGWASETLIIINTTLSDNTQGSSYWFEVPSKAVIQLSTKF